MLPFFLAWCALALPIWQLLSGLLSEAPQAPGSSHGGFSFLDCNNLFHALGSSFIGLISPPHLLECFVSFHTLDFG